MRKLAWELRNEEHNITYINKFNRYIIPSLTRRVLCKDK